MSINEVRYLPECGSTNAYVKEHFEEFGPVGAVYTENQTAAQTFVARTTVVLRRQTQLRLDGATQQWTAIFVHDVTFNLDTLWWAITSHNVSNWEADVFQTQGAEGFKAEYVTHQ